MKLEVWELIPDLGNRGKGQHGEQGGTGEAEPQAKGVFYSQCQTGVKGEQRLNTGLGVGCGAASALLAHGSRAAGFLASPCAALPAQ